MKKLATFLMASLWLVAPGLALASTGPLATFAARERLPFIVHPGEGPGRITPAYKIAKGINEAVSDFGGAEFDTAQFLGPRTARYDVIPNGNSDSNIIAAENAAQAAGGGEIDIPPGTNGPGSSVWAEIALTRPLYATAGIKYKGVLPTFTYPNTLSDSGLAFTGGTVFTPSNPGAYPAIEGFYNTGTNSSPTWVKNDVAATTPASQAAFVATCVSNVQFSTFGIDGAFTTGISIGAQNTAGLFYGAMDHLWIQGCGWGLKMENFAHLSTVSSVWTYNNTTGGQLWKAHCDPLIYQPGNSDFDHIYDYNSNCLVRKICFEAQGDPATTNTAALNEIRVFSPQSNRFLAGGTISVAVTIPSALTVTAVSGNTITVSSAASLYNNAALIYVSTGGTLSGLTATTQTYFAINVNTGANTFQVSTSVGGAAVAPGTLTSSPTFDFGSLTITTTGGTTLLANGMPGNFASGFSNFASNYSFLVSIIDATHFMLLQNRASTAPVVTANSPGGKTFTSNGFADIEVGGFLNTGLYTGTASGTGSGAGTQGLVAQSNFNNCDTEGTAGAGVQFENVSRSYVSFNQVPNGASSGNSSFPDLLARDSQGDVVNSPSAMNYDGDGNSSSLVGTGELNTVIQYAPIWTGNFTGETAAGVGGSVVQGHNDNGSFNNNGAAFYPSSMAAQVGTGGNHLWVNHPLLGDGTFINILPSASTFTLTGSNVGTVIITGSTIGTISLPALTNTAGKTNTNGIQFSLYNLSSASQAIATTGSLNYNGQSSYTSHSLAAGHRMDCIGYYNTTTSTYQWVFYDYTLPTSGDIGGDELWGEIRNNYAFTG